MSFLLLLATSLSHIYFITVQSGQQIKFTNDLSQDDIIREFQMNLNVEPTTGKKITG